MFKNYLKVAFRNIFRNKIYSMINILGLAVGVASCVLIYLFVSYEMSYDNYHQDKDRIFRVASESQSQHEIRTAAATSAPVSVALRNDFPQVEFAAKILATGKGMIEYAGQKMEIEDRVLVDKDFLNIFTIPFIKGDPNTALDRPFTTVVTESAARKIFGEEDPMGKTLQMYGFEFEITGILEDSPNNTHLKYNILSAASSLEGKYPLEHWFLGNFHTYIKLSESADIPAFKKSIENLSYNYVKEELEASETTEKYFLQPIYNIHLHSNLISELEPPGNSVYIYLFSTVGILILLVACINFINISTARAIRRSKEVGVKKVVGAHRLQLIWQFIFEASVIFIIAGIFALFLIETALPLFNQLTGNIFNLNRILQVDVLIVISSALLFTIIFAGGYPAVFISMFKPVAVIKGILRTGQKSVVARKIMVVGQFSIAICLIAGSIIVFMQIDYMKNRPLGFSKEQKVLVPMKNRAFREDYQTVKNEFLADPNIVGATAMHAPIHKQSGTWTTKLLDEGDDAYKAINYVYVDPDFIPLYDIELAAGRNFSYDITSDIERAFIINEKAVYTLGLNSPEEAIGKILDGGYSEEKQWEIIGVVKDYNYSGLQSPIEPLTMEFRPKMYRYLSLTISNENIPATLGFIEDTFKELYPDYPFTYLFLDEDFNRQYQSEVQLSRVFNTFSIVGLFIACLGLFGLAAFSAEQRTKEIGVRKVLGASVAGIINLLTKDFLILIALANLTAFPLVYFIADKWLQDFAYRLHFVEWIWALPFAAVLAMIIGIATVSIQSVRAASSNPITALRYE